MVELVVAAAADDDDGPTRGISDGRAAVPFVDAFSPDKRVDLLRSMYEEEV